MAEKLSDDSLKALIDAELRQSVGYNVGKLAASRQKALYYYEGLPKNDLAPPEIDGRSSVVVTEVRNVIESVLPELMAKFASSERVVECEPTKPGDEQTSNIVTDYLNYLFYKKNNGHKVLQTWFKDALLSKAGIVKVFWDDRTEQKREEYRGLDDVELAKVMDDDEVEVTEHSAYPDEDDAKQRQQALEQLSQQAMQAEQAAQQNPQAAQALQQIQGQMQAIQAQPPKMLHDIACVRTKKGGKIAIENVPPEEFMISRKAKDIQNSPFVAHRVLRTASELKSQGYKNVDQISSDENGQLWTGERVERMSFDDDMAFTWSTDAPSNDPSQRMIWLTEAYVRADRDGDGVAELLKITKAGDQLLDVAEVDVIPFVHIVPVIMPHRFFGLSMADLAMEPQRIKTSILRAELDNLYLNVNGRYWAVEGQANLDDLLTSRPGGVVRVKTPQAVGRLDQGNGDLSAGMNMLQYLQQYTEESTGWQRTANAVDNPDSLNTTATAANIQANRAQMRTDLIARNFAEGVVDLFKMMLKLVCQHQDYAEDVQLNGAWVSIDPREWRNQYSFTINVGIGTGSKQQQVQHLMMQLQAQHNSLPLGITNPGNIYQSSLKLSEALGFKNPQLFWTDPSKNPPPQHPDPNVMKMQADMQAKQQELQMKDQADQRRIQAEMQLEQWKQQQQHQQIEAQNQLEAQRDALKAQHQAEVEKQKAMLQAQIEQQRIEFERWKAQLQAETQILTAQIAAQTTLSAQQMSAAEAAEKEESGEY